MSDGEPSTHMPPPPDALVRAGAEPPSDGATMNGGRFDFDDGGTYCGGWEVSACGARRTLWQEGKAHGHGVCTGPKGQGEYAGAWHYGFEVSGVYVWPSGNTYSGQWQNGKRHGLGVETRGRWIYRGEWTQGYKGRYGTRQSANSNAAYAGTWSSGLQDGYGTETYADSGTYQGQWLRGMRHGYGIRKSAAYGVAAKFRSRSHAHASLTSLRSNEDGIMSTHHQHEADPNKPGQESRGGFVLRARSDAPQRRRRSLSERTLHMKNSILTGLRIKKQKSTSDIHARVTGTGETPRSVRSSGSTMSCTSDESGYDGRHDDFVPPDEHVEPSVTETYMGEWKNDKRSGFGISERSDGLKYEGEWFNNKKFGYGVTTLKDGVKEEGKYKNNILVTSQRKKHLLFVRSSKLRERIDAAVQAANRAAQIALQKADIAVSRMATARDRSEQADVECQRATADSDMARIHAKQFDPNFTQPGIETMRRQRFESDIVANNVGYTTLPNQAKSLDRAHDLPGSSHAFHTRQESMPEQAYDRAHDLPGASHAFHTRQESMPEQAYDLDASQDYIGAPPGSSQQQQANQQHHAQVSFDQHDIGIDLSAVDDPQTVITVPTTMIVSSDGPSTSFAPSGGQTPTAPLAPLPSTPPQQPTVRVSHRRFEGDNASLEGDPNTVRWHDHYEQYVRAGREGGQANDASTAGLNKTGPLMDIPGIAPASGVPIQRRSTLSSNRDQIKAPSGPATTTADDSAVRASTSRAATTVHGMGELPVGPAAHGDEKGSLPTLPQLNASPVVIRREDVARMSSQRRQEVLRLNEEEELLRGNPLRYLFHPAVRAWVIRWKLPLLVVLVNVCLSIVFYQLLTFEPDDGVDS